MAVYGFMISDGGKNQKRGTLGAIYRRIRASVGPFESSRILRRVDQFVIGGILAAMLVSFGIWWLGDGQGTIEIDSAPPQTVQFQVDLNRAEPIELMQIPGIGTTLASRIVDSRKAEGPYNQRTDVQRVKGIGQKTFDRIEKYLLPLPGDGIVVGGPRGDGGI